MSSNSLFAQIMAPGGGVILIPFTRCVIMCLFILTVTVFIWGVARIHMAILGFLSLGMWIALGVFQKEYEKLLRSKPEQDKSNTIKKRKPSVTSSKRED